jgi:hypothetical protein
VLGEHMVIHRVGDLGCLGEERGVGVAPALKAPARHPQQVGPRRSRSAVRGVGQTVHDAVTLGGGHGGAERLGVERVCEADRLPRAFVDDDQAGTLGFGHSLGVAEVRQHG